MANQVSNNDNANPRTLVSRFDSNKLLPNGAMPTRNGVKGQSLGRVARTNAAPQDTFESTQTTTVTAKTNATQMHETKKTHTAANGEYTVSISEEAKAMAAESGETWEGATAKIQKALYAIAEKLNATGQTEAQPEATVTNAHQAIATQTTSVEQISQASVNNTQSNPAANNTATQMLANVRFGSNSVVVHSENEHSRLTAINTDDSYRAFAGNDGQTAYSFTTVEGSFLRNVQNGTSNARDTYFRMLFQLSTENANTVLDHGISGVTVRGWHANTLEASIARHAELREEVYRVFGHDSELLAENLQSLDRAFEVNNRNIAHFAASQMEYERFSAAHMANRSEAHTPHALGNHSAFNHAEFERNTTEMMNQFSQFHLSQMNSGVSFNDALQAAISFMNNVFGITTSVNNLSFNDFIVLQANLFSDNANASEQAAERNRLNSAFNNSAELSAELRALLIAE